MKRIKRIGHQDWHDTDPPKIQAALREAGYYATLEECRWMWQEYSDSIGSHWRCLPMLPGGIVDSVRPFFTVEGDERHPEVGQFQTIDGCASVGDRIFWVIRFELYSDVIEKSNGQPNRCRVEGGEIKVTTDCYVAESAAMAELVRRHKAALEKLTCP